jgi:hypothetical protein
MHKTRTKLALTYHMLEKTCLFFTTLSVHPVDQRNAKRNKIKYEVTQIRKQDMVRRIEGFNVDELYENNSREV